MSKSVDNSDSQKLEFVLSGEVYKKFDILRKSYALFGLNYEDFLKREISQNIEDEYDNRDPTRNP